MDRVDPQAKTQAGFQAIGDYLKSVLSSPPVQPPGA